MIRKSSGHELNAVMQNYLELMIFERRKGNFSRWVSGVFPSQTTLRRAIAKDELYSIWDDKGSEKKICGAFAMSGELPPEFRGVLWPCRIAAKEAMTVRLLCVTPLRAREGLATQALHYAMVWGQKRGYKAIRAAVPAGNIPAEKLFAKLGFTRVCEKMMSLYGDVTENHVLFEIPLEGTR